MQSQRDPSPQPDRPQRKPVPQRPHHGSRQSASDSSWPFNNGTQQPMQQASTSPTESLLGGVSSSPISKAARTSTKESGLDAEDNSGCSERRSTSIIAQLLLSCAVFAVTAWFAQATFSDAESSRTRDVLRDAFKVDIRDTLTVLAILSGLLGLVSGVSIDTALETIQWWLTCRTPTVSMSTILAVSPTTGAFGTFKMLYGRGPTAGARSWAASKLLLRLGIWISGVVLFVNTDLKTFYKASHTYAAQSGVGQFDGAFTSAFLEELYNNSLSIDPSLEMDTVLPFTNLVLANNFIINTQHSFSVSHDGCDNKTCKSYILPGGLEMSHPFPPVNYTEDPVIIFDSVPAVQIDFRRGIDAGDDIGPQSCNLFFQHPFMMAIRFCLAPSQRTEGTILSTIYICDQGSTGDICLSDHTEPPSISSSMSLYVTTASMIVARENNTILAVPEVGTRIPDHSLNFTAYRDALHWLLNNTAAGIPAPSSLAEYFWSHENQVADDAWSAGPRHALHSLLAYPLWFFQINNVGNTVVKTDEQWKQELPSEFHTTARVARPYTKIVVNRAMFVTFAVLQSLVLLFAWGVVLLGWFTKVRLPKLSAFPLAEFVFRTRLATRLAKVDGGDADGDAGARPPVRDAAAGDDDDSRDDVVRQLRGKRGGDQDVLAVARGVSVGLNGRVRSR